MKVVNEMFLLHGLLDEADDIGAETNKDKIFREIKKCRNNRCAHVLDTC